MFAVTLKYEQVCLNLSKSNTAFRMQDSYYFRTTISKHCKKFTNISSFFSDHVIPCGDSKPALNFQLIT